MANRFRILKTNTAVRLVVGPFVSLVDGYSLKTGLTVTGLAMDLWSESDAGSAPTQVINGVAFTVSGGGTNDMVELARGHYDIEITAAQTNWIGRGQFQIYDVDQILPYSEDWLVVSADAYAALTALAGTPLHSAFSIADAATLTADSIADHLRKMSWYIYDKMIFTTATGAYALKKDDGLTAAASGSVEEDSTSVTRSVATFA